MIANHNLAQKILGASRGRFLKLPSCKAERASREVVRVNPRETSRGLSYNGSRRDYISAFRIKMEGRNYPRTPAEEKPPLHIPAKVVVGQAFSMKQEAPSYRGVVHSNFVVE